MREGKPTDPMGMMAEIEAYLTFRLLADDPTVPQKDMQAMKDDIAECLRINGVDVNFKPNKAVAVLIPRRKGNTVLVLCDPALQDVVTELTRYAQAGEESPLAKLMEHRIKL